MQDRNYDPQYCAGHRDAHGVFGRVVACVGWAEGVTEGFLCPLTVRLLNAQVTESEARALLGEKAVLLRVLDSMAGAAEVEAALCGEPLRIPTGLPRTTLYAPELVAIAVRVLEDMVLEPETGPEPGLTKVSHVVVYSKRIKDCYIARDVFKYAADRLAIACEHQDADSAERYRSISMACVSSYQDPSVVTGYLESFRRAERSIIFNVGCQSWGEVLNAPTRHSKVSPQVRRRCSPPAARCCRLGS